MKEYRGIIKDIIVKDNSINSIFNINDEVIVVEDKVLGNKTYNIYHKGDDYND